jgi:ankyrin repeat protein
LAHGADPCAENKSGLTPCDLAAVKNHHEVALLLESRMVSSVTPEETVATVRRVSTFEGVLSEGLGGLRAQDLVVWIQ